MLSANFLYRLYLLFAMRCFMRLVRSEIESGILSRIIYCTINATVFRKDSHVTPQFILVPGGMPVGVLGQIKCCDLEIKNYYRIITLSNLQCVVVLLQSVFILTTYIFIIRFSTHSPVCIFSSLAFSIVYF